MLPLRAHLSPATTALVLAIPVVVGVASGGYLAGVISVIAGFVVYDFFFIPPYLTLRVGATENWVALVVYAAVMLPVARVVAGMNLARAQARERGLQIRRLFELSTLLVEDRPCPTCCRDLRPLPSPRSRHRHRPGTGDRQDLPRRARPTDLGR